MNEDHNDAGYDRDGDIGPFFDAVCDGPPLHGPDEEEIGFGVTSKVADIPEPVTSKIRDIEKLKVVELKDALSKRGCSAKGNKTALPARLKDAIEKNLSVVSDIGEGEVKNFAGEDFSVGTKCELEAANDDDVCIEEGIGEIGGTVFREPTVRPAEYAEYEHGATKKNYTLNFDRPPFISSCKHLELNRYQNPMKDQKGDCIYEDRTHTESLQNLDFLIVMVSTRPNILLIGTMSSCGAVSALKIIMESPP